jgi:polysaccharide export outer membrane protein
MRRIVRFRPGRGAKLKTECRLAAALSLLLATLAVGAAPSPDPRGAADEFRIGPEDVLEIAVWDNAELSRTVPVRPDGRISLPLVNDIQASGLTPMELRATVIAGLAAFLPNPEVSVIVREVHSAKVSVIGEVHDPGRYELRGKTTVLDALALAGGLGEFANDDKIFVLRRQGSATVRLPFDFKRIASSRNKPEPFLLHPGDIVVVP